ncbi:MAG: exopolyphosphatase [Acidobacteria bacterium RBG_16_64_8]|nr:MAG: exopolyphosphatase [Acidobacteria bacterium RBG_16_64_8]
MVEQQRYRLVTRGDFDGLASAVLLKSRDLIDEGKFAHPKDVQDGKVEITGHDITTNLPYSPKAHWVFDHHSSEKVRIGHECPQNLVLDTTAPSAAHVVYGYFGGKIGFPSIPQDLLVAVDKADSAQFTKEEVLDPQGWVLLNFLMDARTGLGRFTTFSVSNYQLMMELIDYCRGHAVAEVLALPHVVERVALYREHQEPFRAQLTRCATVHDNLVVVDLRNEDIIYVGNRFVIYALFPQCNISMHVLWGLKKQNTVLAMGKSIFNRTSKTNIGDLALQYGGGGHEAAATCQVDNDRAETVKGELVRQINADG